MRKYFGNLRIAQRFMLAITPVLIILLVGGCFLLDRYVSSQLTESFGKSVSLLANSLHESVKGSLERGQMKNFQKLLWNQRKIEGVIDVSLFSKDGELDMSSSEVIDDKLQLQQPSFEQAKRKKEQFVEQQGLEYKVYVPQITTADCIRCHQGWELNELGGVIRLTYDMTRLKESIKSQRFYLVYGCLILVVIITLLLFFVTRTVTKPVVQMTDAMKQLADDDLTVQIPGQDRKDEIGNMSDAVTVFKENAQQRDELKNALDQMADNFESNVGSILNSVLDELKSIQESVSKVSSNAENNYALSTSVVDSSTNTAANVKAVAKSIDEMNTTNSQINQQVDSAAEISTKAVEHTTQTNELVKVLARSAREIEQVISLISDIAEQTDLLALNATIEAARAGEAGKGFAVVAGEVKELASQTKLATKDIASKIQSIQTSSTESATAIENVGTVLTEINDIAMAIARSVSQQQERSTETAENMQHAAEESEEVSRNLSGVAEATKANGNAARTVQEKLDALVGQTDTLKKNLNEFLIHVRNTG